MTDKEKILAKIELLLDETNYEPYTDEVLGRIKSLKELESYINSLQEGPDKEKLNSMLDEALPNETTESWNKRLQKEPVSEDLEEAAKHYLYSNILYNDVYVGESTDKDCIEMFKAGVKWQKEQMLKNSVECTVHVDAGGYPYIGNIELYDYENDKPLAKAGDKVKVIINN